MNGQHAFLPPSGAAVWVKCAAAPMMWQKYPQIDTIESMEGTAAHWAFEEILAGRLVDVGLLAPNGVVLTEEMVQGAEMFVETIDDVRGDADLHIEERVDIPFIHAQNWGTPDVWFYLHNPTTGILTIYILDYKFGHDPVEEFENWQLINYLAGILEKLGIDGAGEFFTEVNLTVVQPRCYSRGSSVRTWSTKATELRGYFNILRMAAEAACAPNPKATVNPSCEHCSGRHACEVLQKAGMKAASLSRVAIPLDLPPAALGLELTMLKIAKQALDARISGLEESVYAGVLSGERIPGWTVENTQGRQAWTRPVAEVISLGQLMGKDLSKLGAVTPKQAIKAGLPAAIVNSVSASPNGAPKLVPDNLTMLRKVFSK